MRTPRFCFGDSGGGAISDHNGGKSVTNDAENVIADLAPDFDLSRYRVIYKDTRGIWDQMLVDRTGRFAGFSSINERDLPAALAKSPALIKAITGNRPTATPRGIP